MLFLEKKEKEEEEKKRKKPADIFFPSCTGQAENGLAGSDCCKGVDEPMTFNWSFYVVVIGGVEGEDEDGGVNKSDHGVTT